MCCSWFTEDLCSVINDLEHFQSSTKLPLIFLCGYIRGHLTPSLSVQIRTHIQLFVTTCQSVTGSYNNGVKLNHTHQLQGAKLQNYHIVHGVVIMIYK